MMFNEINQLFFNLDILNIFDFLRRRQRIRKLNKNTLFYTTSKRK